MVRRTQYAQHETVPNTPRRKSLLRKSLADYFGALAIHPVKISDAPNSLLAVVLVSLTTSLLFVFITVVADLFIQKPLGKEKLISLVFFPLLLAYCLISARVSQYMLSSEEMTPRMLPLAYVTALSLVHIPFFYAFKYVTKFASYVFLFFQYMVAFFYFRTSVQDIFNFKDERDHFIFIGVEFLMLLLYSCLIVEVFF
jgi:hypothetical protein